MSTCATGTPRLRATMAHARIRSIDVTKCLEVPGVYGTLTGDEVALHAELVEAGGAAPEGLDDGEGLGGKGFVQFYQIDIIQIQASQLQRLGNRNDRTDSHQFGRTATRGK